MTHNFEFTLTDKNTGENVLSDSTPRYTANDIQLLTDPAGGGLAIPFITDTVNNIVSLKAIINNTLYLRIKNTDEYKLSMKIKQVNCCSQQVSKLFIDGRLVCLSCNGVINVPVK